MKKNPFKSLLVTGSVVGIVSLVGFFPFYHSDKYPTIAVLLLASAVTFFAIAVKAGYYYLYYKHFKKLYPGDEFGYDAFLKYLREYNSFRITPVKETMDYKINGYRIGNYKVIVGSSNKNAITYGFNTFQRENKYCISQEEGLFITRLFSDKDTKAICITNAFNKALYASYFFELRKSLHRKYEECKQTREYFFQEEEKTSAYLLEKEGKYEVGIHDDGEYLPLNSFSSRMEAMNEWNCLSYELERLMSSYDLLVRKNKISWSWKREMLRTAFGGFSDMNSSKTE